MASVAQAALAFATLSWATGTAAAAERVQLGSSERRVLVGALEASGMSVAMVHATMGWKAQVFALAMLALLRPA